MADMYDLQGDKYDDEEDYKKAVEYYEKGLKLKIAVYGSEQHVEVAEHYNNLLGYAYYNLEDYKPALECFQKAYEIRKKLLGEDHEDIKTSKRDIEDALAALAEQEAEAKDATATIDEGVAAQDNTSPQALREAQATQKESTKHHQSGQAHKDRYEYDKAIACFQKAYDIRKQCLGEAHEATKASLEALAATYDVQVRSYVAGPAKDPQKAIACFEQVLQCKLKLYGQTPHVEVANAYNNLGAAYGQQQMYDRAVVHFQKALAVYQQCLGKDHNTTELCVSNLAFVRKKRAKQEAGAKAAADKASEQGS